MKKTSKKTGSSAPAQKSARKKPTRATKRTPSVRTLLVVDDEEHIAKMGQLFLELNGYKVLVANGGAEALALWADQSSEIDLVITDLVMPSIDGATLTRALRKKQPKLPIILATGADEGDFTAELKGLKFSAHLQKPYTRDSLLTAVQKALPAAAKSKK